MGRSIAIVNPKGGSGKTTTAVNLAACLSRRDYRILLLDFDPQGHSALALGFNPSLVERCLSDVLTHHQDVRLSVQQARLEIDTNLDLIPAGEELNELVAEWNSLPTGMTHLHNMLQKIFVGYDGIIMDCPSNLGPLTRCLLRSAAELLVPLEAARFSLHSVQRLLQEVQQIGRDGAGGPVLYGIVSNFDNRSAFARMMIDEQREAFPGILLRTAIGVSSKVREAAYCGQPVVQYAPHCRVAKQFWALTDEIIDQGSRLDRLMLQEAVPHRAIDRPEWEEVVRFRVHAPRANRVCVAGSFNQWCPNMLQLEGPDRDGYWHASMALPPGAHLYKVLVDENWMLDPENPLRQSDEMGNVNSIIEI